MNPQLSVALTLSDKFLFQQMETITEKSQQALMFSDWGDATCLAALPQ